MWYQQSVFYQIYTLGFCGAPLQNDGVLENRIKKVEEWIPYLQKLGIQAVLFNPVFESDAHGYDTRDYKKIDARLGTDKDFAAVCRALHKAGLKVVLDGVFNHVGRGFWAFQDVVKNREASPYKDWFHIDFGGESNYGDGLWYEGWEGHFDLVKLNLQNNRVVEYLLGCVGEWIDTYDIDGLRLDVAYTVDHGYMMRLREFVDGKKADFFLVGEMLFGDYREIVRPDMLESATNYECFKGMYSSLNTANFYEIAYSLNRQFGAEDWTLYKGLHLFNFIDNHDVTRAATVLHKKNHLPLLFGMLFGIPGIPCIYYGSEWGAEGDKGGNSDAGLRPAFDKPVENDLSALVTKMCHVYVQTPALLWGGYREVFLTNQQFVFERKTEDQRVLVALNLAAEPFTAHFDAGAGTAQNLLSGNMVDFGGGLEIPGETVWYLKMER